MLPLVFRVVVAGWAMGMVTGGEERIQQSQIPARTEYCAAVKLQGATVHVHSDDVYAQVLLALGNPNPIIIIIHHRFRRRFDETVWALL